MEDWKTYKGQVPFTGSKSGLDDKGLGPWDFSKQNPKFGYLNNPGFQTETLPAIDYEWDGSDEPKSWPLPPFTHGPTTIRRHTPCGHWHGGVPTPTTTLPTYTYELLDTSSYLPTINWVDIVCGGVPGDRTWVAVGYSGALGYIAYSKNDGRYWNLASISGDTFTPKAVIWTGSLFYIVCYTSEVLYSSDGITWTLDANLGNCYSIRMNDIGQICVTVQNHVWYKVEGGSWTNTGYVLPGLVSQNNFLYNSYTGQFIALFDDSVAVSAPYDVTSWSLITLSSAPGYGIFKWSLASNYILSNSIKVYRSTSQDLSTCSWSDSMITDQIGAICYADFYQSMLVLAESAGNLYYIQGSYSGPWSVWPLISGLDTTHDWIGMAWDEQTKRAIAISDSGDGNRFLIIRLDPEDEEEEMPSASASPSSTPSASPSSSPSAAMGTEFIGSESSDLATSGTGLTINVPSGTQENDLMFMEVGCRSSSSTSQPLSTPSGWTLLGSYYNRSNYKRYVLYRVVPASPPSSYSITFTSSVTYRAGTIITYRGGFNVSDPIDAHSFLTYVTNDTILRGGSITASVANETLLLIGLEYRSAGNTCEAPTTPSGAAWNEDLDAGSSTSQWYRHVYRGTFDSTGNTGNVDATLANSNTIKSAALILLNPET